MGFAGLLEAAIGLVFVYTLLSLFCSALNEFLAQYTRRRGEFLRDGLVQLVGDRWMYLRTINHPLVAVMYRDVPGKPQTPSYIPAGSFVSALLDVVMLKASQLTAGAGGPAEARRGFAEIRAALVTCKAAGYAVADAMLPLVDAAQGDLTRALGNLEAWYGHMMERVSGWYKRHTVRVLFIIGLAVSALFNVDTVQIATELARSAGLRRSLADAAQAVVETKRFNGIALDVTDADVKVAYDDLARFAIGVAQFERQGLPVGFSCLAPRTVAEPGSANTTLATTLKDCWYRTRDASGGYWVVKLVGWLITAVAVSFGAPFWFDLLNKLVNVRAAGRKPAPPPSTVTDGAAR